MKTLEKIKSTTALTIEPETKLTYIPHSFFHNIKFALHMTQIFGIMPLSGLFNNSGEGVSFQWISFKMLYAMLHIIGAISAGIFCVLKMVVKGFVLDETAIFGFYMLNGFAAIHYIYLATKWKGILKSWSYVEYCMKNYRANVNIKRINILTTMVFMFFGIIEHLLFILTALHSATRCANFSKYPFEIYFGCAFPHYFTLVAYSHWLSCLVEVSNFISTFTWNFADLFIILISMSLREKFNQITVKIQQNKNSRSKFWREIREDYLRVSNLTRNVDRHIASLVLLTYVNNIFFLCIQLYNSIKERTAAIESVYFFYSFGFIVSRVVAVSLYSATLNEAAKKPLAYLYALPTENYCLEVNRLINQIIHTPNGITGYGFFLITKNFLLRAAATVVTFELMLFQFAPSIDNRYNVRSEAVCIR